MYNSWEMRKCDIRVKSDQKESLEASQGRIYSFSQGVPARYKSWEMRNCDIRVKSDLKESLEASQGLIYPFHRGYR